MRNKKGIGLITLIIIIAVILVISGVIWYSVINKKTTDEGTGGSANNNLHNQNTNIEENNTTVLHQEYFNKNYSSKNKLSIVLPKDVMNGPNVFIGIELEGIAEDLYYDVDNFQTLRNERCNFRIITNGYALR